MRYKIHQTLLLASLLSTLLTTAQEATLVLHNAKVYTVDAKRSWAEAVAIRGDRILSVGSEAEIGRFVGPGTERIDCNGRFLMPGLIEGHGHIHGMGASLVSLDLMKVRNWDDIVAKVAEAAKTAKPGDWIVGRGWHQEKWDKAPVKNHLGYPYHETLDMVAPNNPVLLTHASGHSSYVNGLAMRLAGIDGRTPNPKGGDIVKDGKGTLVGVLEETAQSLAYKPYNEWLMKRPESERKDEWRHSIRLAEQECLRNGVTSFVDAGSSFQQVEWMKELALAGRLDIRHYMMIRTGIEDLKKRGGLLPIQDVGNGYLTVRSLKVSLDGALGSYGAWLLEPYTDRKEFLGQNTFPVPELKSIADFAWGKGLQLCVHAIGDRANRETIDIFAEQIRKDPKADHRWRIEHAQHLNPVDIPRFRQWNIIAAMQSVHCTSDAPFVPKRLGDKRSEEGAYMWRAFIDAGVLVSNGTDVPVEDIDPFANLHAAVTRQLKDGSRFYPAQRMTRAEAIHSYTLANAVAAFEERDKGSIEAGKLADMVLLSENLMECHEDRIPQTRVLLTIVGGKTKYKSQTKP